MTVTVIKNNGILEIVSNDDTIVIAPSGENNIETSTFVLTGTQYDGTYEITPRVESQSMPTKNKLMRKNVLVHGVPRYEVANQYGTTCYIAADV